MANPEQARHAFTSAFSFHEAAIRCADTPGIEAPKGVSDLPGPHAVCLAFAAELYLKAVILRRLSKQDGHNLKWLFNEGLNPAERDAVIAEFEKQECVPVSGLPHLLENFQRTFEQWRYLYERPTMELQVGGLAAFTRALYHAVRSFEPAWEIPATIHERISANNKNKKLITVHVGEDLNLPPHILICSGRSAFHIQTSLSSNVITSASPSSRRPSDKAPPPLRGTHGMVPLRRTNETAISSESFIRTV